MITQRGNKEVHSGLELLLAADRPGMLFVLPAAPQRTGKQSSHGFREDLNLHGFFREQLE
jgi:hypothetical protein